jgi:hypothetical protein
MANEQQVRVLKAEGGEAWNKRRYLDLEARGRYRKVDLSGADLRGVDLSKANLAEADLSGAKLLGANLRTTDLTGADLRGANLHAANLSMADLRNSDLRGANLSDGNLRRTNLEEACLAGVDLSATLLGETMLDGADLSTSKMVYTTFANVDLSYAKGLERVNHLGPSSVGIDTIFRSKGRIPEGFLRGVGVPEEFITYMKSLVTNPIEFYSCFISYSMKNHEFADRLYSDLQNKNVRCWFAPHDVQGGKKLHQQIDEAIRLHEKVLLILSTESMNSEWVKTEIAKARQRELSEKKRVLFPVRLVSFEAIRDWECFDADTGKDSAREIRDYFIPDFSQWKEHEKYKKAFERLLTDLKIGERVAATAFPIRSGIQARPRNRLR